MRYIFHFFFAVLSATLTIAAPALLLQTPLGKVDVVSKDTVYPYTNVASKPSSLSGTSGALGASEASPKAAHLSRPKKFPLPYVVKTPAGHVGHNKDRLRSMPSWIKKWRGPKTTSKAATSMPENDMHFHKASSSELSCFCAGGSICCHTEGRLDCNAGYCGI